jgi:PPM family protein phosphatase
MPLEFHGLTNVGPSRKENQDRILLLPEHGCFAVWDGIGGQRSGDVAAEMGVTVLQRYIESSLNPAEVTWPFGYNVKFSLDSNRLFTSLRLANRQIVSRSDHELKYAGMGACVVATLIRGSRVAMANIGDSRIYIDRGGDLQQFSIDDTITGLMLREGVVTVEGAADHPMRGILTQAVGTPVDLDVHLREEELQTGDVVLLCSDGLYNALPSSAISAVLNQRAPVAQRTQKLIDCALAAKASDNVSCIVIEFR